MVLNINFITVKGFYEVKLLFLSMEKGKKKKKKGVAQLNLDVLNLSLFELYTIVSMFWKLRQGKLQFWLLKSNYCLDI